MVKFRIECTEDQIEKYKKDLNFLSNLYEGRQTLPTRTYLFLEATCTYKNWKKVMGTVAGNGGAWKSYQKPCLVDWIYKTT